jgi:hypothetical protein
MGFADEEGRRLVRALTWVRLDDPCDNGTHAISHNGD